MRKFYLLLTLLAVVVNGFGQQIYSEEDGVYYDKQKIVDAQEVLADDFALNQTLYIEVDNVTNASCTGNEDGAIDVSVYVKAGEHLRDYEFSYTRGYWFQARSDFNITGLMAAEDCNPLAEKQSLEIVDFGLNPPREWDGPSPAVTPITVFSAIDVLAGWVTCNVPLVAGNYYGIIGARHDEGGTTMFNSYSVEQELLFDGLPTFCKKLNLQSSLALGSPSPENYGNGSPPYIGRIHVKTDDSYTYAWTGPDAFTANTEDISGLGEGTYQLTVSDEGSNTASRNVDVQSELIDTEPPVFVDCGGGSSHSFLEEIAADNSGGHDGGDQGGEGSHGGGGGGIGEGGGFHRGDIFIDMEPGQCTVVLDLDNWDQKPHAVDNCGEAVVYAKKYRRANMHAEWITVDGPVELGPYRYQIKWGATDNSEFSDDVHCAGFFVTVNPYGELFFDEACPLAPVTAYTSDDGGDDCGTTVDLTYPTASSDTDADVVVDFYRRSDGLGENDIYPTGTTTVMWRARLVVCGEPSGKWTYCEQDVIVEDDQAPDLSLVEGQSAFDVYGSYDRRRDALTAQVAPVITPHITDNCGIDRVEYSQSEFNRAGGYTITVTAWDQAGNSSSCEARVAVYLGFGRVTQIVRPSPIAVPYVPATTSRTTRKSGEVGVDFDNMYSGQLELKAYPNPTSGRVMLELDNFNNPDVQVKVINLAGQKVFEQKYSTSGQVEIDLTGNKTGVYLINVLVDEQQFIRKINLVE